MPRLANEIRIHLEKARDSAFLGVETYNRPRTSFRSGGYIVLMCIAWTALFHAIFFKRRVKPFYRRKSNRRHFEVLDGDKKAWELSTCTAEFWGRSHPAARHNLDFFIRLRNKIEHRSMPGLDIDIFGECQAFLFNFEELIVLEFGEKYALNESLSLALQFSCHRNEQQEIAVRKLHRGLARDITSYIEAFRTSLSAEQREDLAFSYKVFLLPKPANHQGSADLAVEFVKYDSSNPDEMARINHAIALIKPVPTTTLNPLATLSAAGTPVRIDNNDPRALVIQAVTYDHTHPYRQKELIEKIKPLLPMGVVVSSHDLQSIRAVYHIRENRNYFYQARFGSAQYSDQYAQWLLEKIQADANFLSDTRERYRTQRPILS